MFSKNTLNAKLLLVLFILSVIIFSGCAARRYILGDPETGLMLQYRIEEKQLLEYKSLEEINQNIEIPGQSVEVNMNSAYKFSVDSKGLKGNNHQLEITINSMDLNIVSPQGEISPDMSNVNGKSFDMILSRLGKEMNLSGAENIQYEIMSGNKRSIVTTFQSIFPDLPDRTVKIGDTWITRDTISDKTGNEEVMIVVESVNTLEGIETVNGHECIKITSPVKGTYIGKGKAQGMDYVSEGEIEGTSTWYFDYKKGILVKDIVNTRTESTITTGNPYNPPIPMVMESKFETLLIK